MEYNGIAAKRRKKLKSYCFYAHFASLRGYSLSDLEGWGDRRDLNPRQPDPQSGALTRLSYGHQPAEKVSARVLGVKLLRKADAELRNGDDPAGKLANRNNTPGRHRDTIRSEL